MNSAGILIITFLCVVIIIVVILGIALGLKTRKDKILAGLAYSNNPATKQLFIDWGAITYGVFVQKDLETALANAETKTRNNNRRRRNTTSSSSQRKPMLETRDSNSDQ